MLMDKPFIVCDENEVDDQDGNEIKKEEVMSKQRKKVVKPRSDIWDHSPNLQTKTWKINVSVTIVVVNISVILV